MRLRQVATLAVVAGGALPTCPRSNAGTRAIPTPAVPGRLVRQITVEGAATSAREVGGALGCRCPAAYCFMKQHHI
jgi:hypothetical protein